MGLFDTALVQVREFLGDKEKEGELKRYRDVFSSRWSRSPGIILKKDTGIELGNPSVASRYFLIWTKEGPVADGTISLIGPELSEAHSESLPFAQVVIVRGDFADEYEGYRNLRDAIFQLKLWGFATRTLPGRQNIWCRISKGALRKGFSLKDLGGALIEELKGVQNVKAVEVIFVTASKSDVEALKPVADGVSEIVEALIKMYEEMTFDCETCEYKEVCDSVKELKNIKSKLMERKGIDG